MSSAVFQALVQADIQSLKSLSQHRWLLFLISGVFIGLDFVLPLWRKRWIVVKETWLLDVNPRTGNIGVVMLMDTAFSVQLGERDRGRASHTVYISNSNRVMAIRSWSRRRALEWYNHLRLVAESDALPFTSPNPFGSFAPVRPHVLARAFVDGEDYMAAAWQALSCATEEIFIAGWFLSPEVLLKRCDAAENCPPEWRLMNLLQNKATDGIRVFVLLYHELALSLNSAYTARILTGLHPLIKVIRAPDHVTTGIFYWGHHEKLLVVDQLLAFVGGIDLAFGRWDTPEHPLIDLGTCPNAHRCPSRFFTSADVKGISQRVDTAAWGTVLGSSVTTEEEQNGIRALYEELFHNPIRRLKVLSRLHIQTPARSPCSEEGEPLLLNTESSLTTLYTKRDTHRGVFCAHRWEANQSSSSQSEERSLSAVRAMCMWPGKDYINYIVKDFRQLEQPNEDLVERCRVPRMPWHDVHAGVLGKSGRDVARHFIQRWNYLKEEMFTFNPDIPFLLPKTYSEEEMEREVKQNPVAVSFISGTTFQALKPNLVRCQILRSAGQWSLGLQRTEQSIHDAMVDCIESSQWIIYIECQFFVSPGGNCPQTKNRVGEALFRRITKAHRNEEDLKVFIVLPLLPNFEGQVGTPGAAAMQAVSHWNYQSISRGPYSLLKRLSEEAGIDHPENYVTFFSLRTWDELHGFPVTELVYVHSKLLIVDDRVTLIGSANINDRSLLGFRDTEVAALIKDDVCQRKGFSGTLRRRLFAEHLGEPLESLPETMADMWELWRQRAQRNTEAYEVATSALATRDPIHALLILRRGVKGHLVLFPLEFLCDEGDLMPPLTLKEGLAPTCLWT